MKIRRYPRASQWYIIIQDNCEDRKKPIAMLCKYFFFRTKTRDKITTEVHNLLYNVLL